MLMTYGDAALATAHTAPLARYASYLLGEHNRTGLARLRTGYGDWQPPPPLVPNQNFSGPQGTPLVSAFSLLNDLRMAAEVFRGKPSRWREHRPSVSAFARPDARQAERCAAAKPPLGAEPDGDARNQPWWINWTAVMRERNWPATDTRD